MPDYPVLLSWSEMMLGAQVGIRRRTSSIKRRLKDRGLGPGGWGVDIDGALAEMSVAKLFGVYWDGSVDTFKLPDVGLLQVRSTHYRDGSLVVRPFDSDDEAFVLVITAHAPTYHVKGWLRGRDARKHGILRPESDGRTEAWFVPADRLHPFDPAPTGVSLNLKENFNDRGTGCKDEP